MMKSVSLLMALACFAAPALAAAMPRYAHIFVIIEENHTADQILGNPAAPVLNRLAHEYGEASNYYAIRHISEPNYVAILGGSTFGIADDDAYFCRHNLKITGCKHAEEDGYAAHTVLAPGFMDQLARHGLTWKGYFQSLPRPGSPVYQSPVGDGKALYASKHNGFMNFISVQHDPDRAAKIVGFDALDRDIAANTLPNFAEIVPDQCHDMHGIDACSDGTRLVADADRLVGQLVARITATPMWKGPQNSAIVITFDEDNGDSPAHPADRCCGSRAGDPVNPGGGWVATIVVTNHGPRGLTDPTPYNHFSLLRTMEDAFGIRQHLGFANDTARGVTDMTPLFAVRR